MSGVNRNNVRTIDAPGVAPGKGVACSKNDAVTAVSTKLVDTPHSLLGTNTSFIPIPADPAFCDNYKCKKCNVTATDDVIKCQTCERFVHGKCEGLASKQVLFLNMFKDDIPYFCKECRYIIKSHLGFLVKSCGDHLETVEEKVTNIDDRVQKLETNVVFNSKTELQTAVNELVDKRFQDINKQIAANNESLQFTLNEKVQNSSTDIKADFRDSYKRRNRIVFFNLPDNNNDERSVQLLSNELGLQNIKVKKTFRIKSRSQSNTILPLNVEFCSSDDKNKFLNLTTKEKIRDLPSPSTFYGISVASDRSYIERQEYRSLRQNMDAYNERLANSGNTHEKWIIRKMCLLKIKANPKLNNNTAHQ